MSLPRRRRLLRVGLPVGSLFAWLLFLVLRPPEHDGYLAELDRGRRTGDMVITSGAPYTYIAERPLRNWSPFHGGEQPAVILLVLAHAPVVFGVSLALHWLSFPGIPGISLATLSWLRCIAIVLLSALQWYAVGAFVESLFLSRSPKHPGA